MDNKLKLMARYLISVLALSILVVVGVALLDLHDFRVLLGVIAGMSLGPKAFSLTAKIKPLQADDEQV